MTHASKYAQDRFKTWINLAVGHVDQLQSDDPNKADMLKLLKGCLKMAQVISDTILRE